MAQMVQYDKVEWIEIGFNDTLAANYCEIDNVVSFADRVVSPDGDMVYPMTVINLYSPAGVHHNHKYWEMEMVLDTDYIPDTGSMTTYWAYGQDVQALGGSQYAIVCNNDNNYIEWFKVYIRESDGSQTRLTYADEDQEIVWCISETSDFNNEPGTRHQTTTFKFICYGERTKTHSPANTYTRTAASEANVKYMRVDSIAVNAVTATNVLRFRDDFVMQMTPQFVPNVFQGQDLKQDEHWRILTFVVDSECGIFDTYVDIITANTVVPANTAVVFTLADGAGTTRTWTYSSSIAYIINRREGETHHDLPRDTTEYQMIVNCNKTVS